MKPTLLLATLTLAAITSVSLAASSTADGTYTVSKGDSIERIARKTGTSVAAITSANGLKKNAVIHPGQRLKVPGAKAPAAPASTAAATPSSTPAAAPAAPAKASGRYTVKQGDTFYSISKKQGISTSSLMAANPKVKANALRPGLVLNLRSSAAPATTKATASKPARTETTTPVVAEKTSKTIAETPAPQPKAQERAASAPKAPVETAAAPKAPAEPASAPKAPAPSPAPSSVTKSESPSPAPVAQQNATPAKKEVVRPVTIDGEMTYGQFAQKHNTSSARLNELNGLDLSDATLLAKGSELYIPAQP